MRTLGSELLNQLVIVTLGKLLQVAPDHTQFLLRHTLNRVTKPTMASGHFLLLHPNPRNFNQEDVRLNTVAVDQNLPILSTQIAIGALNDVLLDTG